MKYPKRITTSLALGAVVLALGACKSEPESFNTGTNDPMDSELANAAPVELPPCSSRPIAIVARTIA